MNNKNSVFHESKCATYIDNGDGSLAVFRKGGWSVKATLAYFKNDHEGQAAYKRFRGGLKIRSGTRVYKMYRCPKGGRTYDVATGVKGWTKPFKVYPEPDMRQRWGPIRVKVWPPISRRGNIRKKDSMLFSVIQTGR